MELRSIRIKRSSVLLALGVLYVALAAASFAPGVDLETNGVFQCAVHIAVMAGAIAYVYFAEMIYRVSGTEARMALIFAALFALPVVLGRGIGIYAISNASLAGGALNFYGTVSVSRTIEMLSWTVLFPISMLGLSRVFRNEKQKLLSVLCLLSAVCCFIAFLSLIFPEAAVFTLIGMTGWGVLFVLVVLVYLVKAVRESGKNS